MTGGFLQEQWCAAAIESKASILNEGRYEEAADELLRWVFCNGRRLRGLMLRRTDERGLFLA